MRSKIAPTYLRCKCGFKEDGVCALFYGWTCPDCGGVDTADIIRRRAAVHESEETRER